MSQALRRLARRSDGASLRAEAGSITGLIGPNGAGKTTLFAMIAGFLTPDAGAIAYEGADITGMAPHRLARRGHRAHVPDRAAVRRPDGAGEHRRRRPSAPRFARARRARPQPRCRARVGLRRKLDRPAATLTVAGRKRLELARALATGRSFLLLDEVLAGLNPSEIRDMLPVIRAIRDRGVTILMIEHVMQAVMSLAEHVYVLVGGAHHRARERRQVVGRIRVSSRPISAAVPRRLRGREAPMAEPLAHGSAASTRAMARSKFCAAST